MRATTITEVKTAKKMPTSVKTTLVAFVAVSQMIMPLHYTTMTMVKTMKRPVAAVMFVM